MGSNFPALDIRQPESPLDQYAKMTQLKSLLGQQAMQPGQLQLQQQQIEAQKRQLDDASARTAALREWSQTPGSIPASEIPKLILKHGGSADAYDAAVQHQIDQQTKMATLDKDTLDNMNKRISAEGAASNAVLALDPSLQPAAWAQKQRELVASGVIKPTDVQPYDPDMLKLHAAAAMSVKDQIDTTLNAQKTAAETLASQARMTQATKPQQPSEAGLAVKAVTPGPEQATSQAALDKLAEQKKAEKPPKDTTAAETTRSDKSYQYSSGQLDKVGQPIEQAIQRFGRLQDTVNQATPQADALVAPELLTVMAGGAGSGLRMNEAEISRIVGGRSNLESLKAALNKWQLDPSKALSITPSQRGQIRDLMGQVYGKLLQKQDVLDKARQDLVNEDDPFKHRMIVTGARNQLTKIDMGQGGAAPAAFKAPSDAPPAPAQDGKVLKSGGKVIAVSKGGQWVSP